ncbi:hypothetical protein [Nocardiopsis synnemataformans]|uniref:hypothetical protein n=1 Tax=Nocardiopsis synnemataformans TaxID=61305 RepID=UPI003EB83C90
MQTRFDHVDGYLKHKVDLPAIPRQGDRVKLDGRKYRVASVTWVIDSDEDPHVRVTLED